MKRTVWGLAMVCSVVMGAAMWPSGRSEADSPPVDADGTVHLPAMLLPESALLSEETRAALKQARVGRPGEAVPAKSCPSMDGADAAHAPAIRRCEAENFYRSASFRRLHELYRVAMTSQTIGGIYTEVFTPTDGIAPKNKNRILINVHGGGFIDGARISSHMESVPIASLGQIKVISIDYRQAPEFEFPAANEDVTAVYVELLKIYKAGNIGIYGCSAGGLLTAETMAWLEMKKLPLPGAIGMLCEGAGYWTDGDAGHLGQVLWGGIVWGTSRDNPYFKNTDPDNALAFPVRSPSIIAKFPPSLLIAATRDPALSSVVHTHSVLINQGVDAELHVWEGLGHAFFMDPDLPQSREVHAVTVKFFDTHLGR